MNQEDAESVWVGWAWTNCFARSEVWVCDCPSKWWAEWPVDSKWHICAPLLSGHGSGQALGKYSEPCHLHLEPGLVQQLISVYCVTHTRHTHRLTVIFFLHFVRCKSVVFDKFQPKVSEQFAKPPFWRCGSFYLWWKLTSDVVLTAAFEWNKISAQSMRATCWCVPLYQVPRDRNADSSQAGIYSITVFRNDSQVYEKTFHFGAFVLFLLANTTEK